MIIGEVGQKKYFITVQKSVQQPQQGQWTNWNNGTAIQMSQTWHVVSGSRKNKLTPQINASSSVLKTKSVALEKEGRSFMPTRSEYTNYRPCPEFLLCSSLTMSIHLEAQQSASRACPSHKHRSTHLRQALHHLQQKMELRNSTKLRPQQEPNEKGCWVAVMLA
ncbi:hypothetical protein ElyMa_000977800 [Elysia marginata]|uniref:Uncharacterized protein n=1 Tax=Elysia marginata TaxID=1093978 RepID=A0AAV4HF47_9GAST|nr:hypothetical protein ElyMa_000977800 [Elysia marginata]